MEDLVGEFAVGLRLLKDEALKDEVPALRAQKIAVVSKAPRFVIFRAIPLSVLRRLDDHVGEAPEGDLFGTSFRPLLLF